ncbi:hypothetical protein ABZ470_39780 [Streptosporangium sp. NPDC020072]|uniref:hypothetical protein n=1 Tax=Streptosporangium sp. NPDC020072 TaxID=3154788 RepID=UPI003436CAD9
MSRNDRAEQNAARRRAERTGEPYQDALAAVRAERHLLETERRYVLTEDVRGWLNGKGWRGVTFGDIEPWSWLATLKPRYECDWCGDDGDARTQDTTLQCVVTAFDPDLSPMTGLLSARRYHAACQPSKVDWVRNIDIPRGPVGIGLPSSVRPDVHGEFALTVRPVMMPIEDEERPEPALLISAAVTEDHGQGEVPWLSELEVNAWWPAGFGAHDRPDFEGLYVLRAVAEDWSVRAVRGYPSSTCPEWAAIRMSPPEDGQRPDHLWLGGLDFPQEWIDAARGRDTITLLAGPIPIAGEVPEIPEKPERDLLAQLLEDGALLTAAAPFELDEQAGESAPEGEPRRFWSTDHGLMG